VIDYVDAACKSWGRCTRWMLTDTNEGFPHRDTIRKAAEGMLSAREKTRSSRSPSTGATLIARTISWPRESCRRASAPMMRELDQCRIVSRVDHHCGRPRAPDYPGN